MKRLPFPSVTRRSVLRHAGIVGAAAFAAPAWAQRAPSRLAPVPPLLLTLTFPNGTSLSFDERQATSLGTYLGPFVQQHCLRQRGPADGTYLAGFTVFFRPDTSGLRQEIVVEYGTEYAFAAKAAPVPASSVRPAHITAPYTATISGGSLAAPVTINVPNHWWGARWRWQSAPRPIVRTLADLVAMKAVLPLSTTPVWNTSPPATGTSWGGPMATGDLNTSLSTTGDREELGFTTEMQACYLLTGNAAAEETMLTDAEASGTFIYHVRDAATNAPFSVEQYPNMSLMYNAGHPGFAIPKPARPSAHNYFNMNEGVAHMPPLGFVPWLLTDDPFFLEEAQFAANYAMTEANYHNINEGLPGLASVSQTRGWAWGMRDLTRMAGFAPAAAPSWLAPRSYWQRCVADNLTFANKYLTATASPATTVFKLIPDTGVFESFMVDFLGTVMGWIGWSGLFPSWSSIVAYTAGPRIAMTDNSGASGWDSRYPVPYLVPIFDANLGVRARGVDSLYSIPASLLTPRSWAQLWSDYQVYAAATVAAWTSPATWPAGTLAPGQNLGYVAEARAALAAFQLAGVPAAASEHAWLYNQLDTILPRAGTPSRYKWAIWPN